MTPDRPLNLITLPEIFQVRETASETAVSCGVATSQTDRDARLAVVTATYLERTYITPDDPHIINGLYHDPHEAQSIPLVAKYNGKVVASMRLILNRPLPLPINMDGVVVTGKYADIIKQERLEISQLANLPITYDDPRISPVLGLVASYFAIGRSLGIPTALGVVDNKVLTLALNRKYHFGLPTIGPSIDDYKGSPSTPTYIDITHVVESVRDHDPLTAAFLAGERNIPGFEWYVGP